MGPRANVMMRMAWLGLIAAGACSKDNHTGSGSVPAPAPPAANVPSVDVRATRPAVADAFVLIKRDGSLAVGKVPTSALGGEAIDLALLGASAATTVGRLREAVTSLDPDDLANLEMIEASEPPPPPEEEEEALPDDESGGTGTAMALDEGKMGKKDSERARGRYNIRANADS